MSYRIFDSMDRPASRETDTSYELIPVLDELNAEAEEDGTGLTYAIGYIYDDGVTVTFEF
jgi:hypothetical protein